MNKLKGSQTERHDASSQMKQIKISDCATTELVVGLRMNRSWLIWFLIKINAHLPEIQKNSKSQEAGD